MQAQNVLTKKCCENSGRNAFQEVKKTNGKIQLEDVVEYQQGNRALDGVIYNNVISNNYNRKRSDAIK